MALNLFQLFGEIVIDSSVAEKTIDSTMEQVDNLKGSLEKVETQSKTTSKVFGKGGALNTASVFLGNMYTKAASVAAKIGNAIVKSGFGFDASMEAYQNQFEALLNSADKASTLVADLQELAKISPLGMEGLANNAVSLLNTGIELADIIPTLEMLGNLSLGDTNKMNSVVRAYTQILSKGQLMAQEMYQLGDAGIPVREIMTLYGGERYADGSWYQQKMADPTYKIMAEDMVSAFQVATTEGGKWHDYMFKMMDTWNGQVDRLGEEGKETLGSLMNPFFDVAKSEALPRLTESMQTFGTFISENQEALSSFATTLGEIAANSFDSLLSFFEWCITNKDVVGTALTVIGAAVGVIAASAHPILAVVGALAAIVLNWNSIVEWLQPAIDKWNALVTVIDNATTAVERFFGVNKGSGVYTFNGVSKGGGFGKKFANGLYRVPYDGFPAVLHKDEAVLNRLDASEWRTANAHGGLTADNSRLETLMGNMIGLMQQVVANTGTGQSIVLDSGALVGQLAPTIDRHLGTLANRKGRG